VSDVPSAVLAADLVHPPCGIGSIDSSKNGSAGTTTVRVDSTRTHEQARQFEDHCFFRRTDAVPLHQLVAGGRRVGIRIEARRVPGDCDQDRQDGSASIPQ
jgi:hypothetical protein